jgi:hypothetical protein
MYDFTLFLLSFSCCGFEKFALKSSPVPNPHEIVERNVEMALEMRARQDPESVPLVALRQMARTQRPAGPAGCAGLCRALPAAGALHDMANPGRSRERSSTICSI